MGTKKNKLWYSFLKHLDVPQKYKITHKIVELLIKLDQNIINQTPKEHLHDLIDHTRLTPKQKKLETVIKKLTSKEAAFQIAQIEYENKEQRIVELTHLTENSINQLFVNKKLLLRDINEDEILEAINSQDMDQIIDALERTAVIISHDIDIYYERKAYLIRLWRQISDELLEKIKSFEYHGLKVVSSNLRVKLIPELEVFKTALKEDELVEGSLSRLDVKNRLDEMVEQAREDIYGELTHEQAMLLNEINPNLSSYELIEILSNPDRLKNLIVLLETNKIEIKMRKVIDRLI